MQTGAIIKWLAQVTTVTTSCRGFRKIICIFEDMSVTSGDIHHKDYKY